LPHVQKHVPFINVCPKLWGSAPPEKFWGQKHAKFGAVSDPFPL